MTRCASIPVRKDTNQLCQNLRDALQQRTGPVRLLRVNVSLTVTESNTGRSISTFSELVIKVCINFLSCRLQWFGVRNSLLLQEDQSIVLTPWKNSAIFQAAALPVRKDTNWMIPPSLLYNVNHRGNGTHQSHRVSVRLLIFHN